MNDDELHPMTGAYVLDSLDDLERAAFERHLPNCEPCWREVAELAATTAEIGSAQYVEPPDSLRQDVFAAVSRTAQVSPSTHKIRTGRRWIKALTGVAVAAAIVVAFALGAVMNSPTPGEQLADEQTQMMIAAAPDAKMMPMDMTDGAHSSIVVSNAEGQALLVADGLPMPTNDDVYQLWLIDQSGILHEMDMFRPDSDGQVTLMMVGDFGEAMSLEMTMEPSGGSRQPTSATIGVAQLT